MAQDFYVSFGSNASAFGNQLKKELAGARSEINAFQADLAKLGTGPAGSALARLMQGLNSGGGGGGGKTPPPAAAPAATSPGIDFGQMAREAASYQAEMDGALRKIVTIVQGFERLSNVITAEERRANRSNGSVQGNANRFMDPATGRRVTAGTPGAVPVNQASKSNNGKAGGQVTIAGTPKVLVDDAAFKRVVNAVEKSTSATKDVRKSIDKLYDLIDAGAKAATNDEQRSGRKGGEGGGKKKDATEAGKDSRAEVDRKGKGKPPANAKDTSVEAIRAERDAGVAQLKAGLQELTAIRNSIQGNSATGKDKALAEIDAKMAQAAAKIAELEKPLQRERSTTNRAAADAARKAAPPSLSAQKRADAARDIAIAGDETSLRTRVKNHDLTKTDLQRIAGTFTSQGYETPFNTKTTNEQLIGKILGSRKAYDESGGVTRQNLEIGGGRNVAATEVSKGVKKLLKEIVAAAEHTAEEVFAQGVISENFATGGASRATQSKSGQARKPGVDQQRGAAFGGRRDEIVSASEKVLGERGDRISEASVRQAQALLAKRPNFNPYDPALRAGITGKGDDAMAARRALASLTRAIEAIDKQLNEAALSPGVRAGVDNRAQARDAFNQARAEREVELRNQSENHYAVKGGIGDALFGGTTALGTKSGTGGDLARLFPGLRLNRKGELGAVDGGIVPQANLAPVKKAYQKYVSAFTELAKMASTGGATPEELLAAEHKAAQGLERYINAYEAASGAKLNTTTVRVGGTKESRPTYGGYDKDLGYGEFGSRSVTTGGTRYRSYGFAQQQSAGYSLPDDILAARNSAEATKARKQAAAGAAAAASSGGGGKPPKTPTGGASTASSGGGKGGNDRDVLSRMLSELVAIHAAVIRGVNLNVRRGDPIKRRTSTSSAEDVAGNANSSTRQAARKTQRAASAYSTAGGRQAFLNDLPPELGASTRDVVRFATSSGKANSTHGVDAALGQATELVTRGFLKQKDAIEFFRQELGLGAKAASKFGKDLRAEVGNQSLAGSAARGNARNDAKQQAQAAILRAHGGYDPALGYGTLASQAQAGAKAAEAARTQSLAQKGVADTTGRVSEATNKEVASLRQLIATGASATQVLNQQVKAYRALNTELREQGVKGAERTTRISQVFGDVGAPNTAGDLQSVRRAASLTPAPSLSEGPGAGGARSKAQNDGEQFGTIMGQGAGNSFQRAFFGNQGFASRVVHSAGTFLVRNASAGLVFGLTNALGDAIDQGIHTESTFVRVSEALDKTGRSSSGLRTNLQGLSEEYGVALKDVYTTTAGLTGLFDSSDKGNQQLLALTRVAVQLQLISGGALNATEAMQSLSSITAAYGDESAQNIADVATVIQNNLGVNIEETIEGVARLSGQTKQMGIDFQHAAVYVAAISKLTNQSGSGAGEQFSRILESFQQGKTQGVVSDSLKTVGVDTRGAFAVRDYQGAIDALLGSYNKLTKAEQARVSTQIGGARQAASINALLSQGSKVLDVVSASQNANGAANERAAQISKQLAAEMNRARQAFVNFFAVLVRLGVLNAFGVALEVIMHSLGIVNKLLSEFSDLIDSSPLLSTVTQWGLAIAGLAVGFAVARKAAASLVAVMNTGVVSKVVGSRVAGGAAAAEGGAVASGGAAAGAGAGGAVAEGGLLAALFGRRGARRGPNPGNFRGPAEAGRVYSSSAGRFVAAEGPLALSTVGAHRADGGVLASPRFGAVNAATGVPLRASQRFYARQSTRLLGASESLGARSASLATRAEQNLAGASYGRGLGYSSVVGRAQQAGAAALSGASSAAGATSNGLARMARNASVANVALLGIGAAAGLAINGFLSFKKTSDQYAAAYKSAFGGKDKGPDKSTQAGQAQSEFDTILKKNDDQNSGFSGISRAFLHTISNPSVLFSGSARRKQSDRDTGNVDDATYQQFIGDDQTKLWTTLGNAHSMKNAAEIDKAIKANEKEVKDAAKAINSSTLSSAQKSSLLSTLSSIHGQLEKHAAQYRLAAEGLNSLDTLTQDQLEAIGPMVSALAGFGTTVQSQLAPLLQQYVGSLGLDKGTSYQKNLQELAVGRQVTSAPGSGTIKSPFTTANKYGVDKKTGQYGYYDSSGKFHVLAMPGSTGWNVVAPVDTPGLTGTKGFPDAGGAPGKVPSNAPTIAPQTTRALTQNQKSSLAITTLETALKASQDQIAALPEGEERTKKIQTAIQLAGQLDTLIQQKLQRQAADASALIDSSRIHGDYNGAANAASGAIAAAAAQLKEGEITKGQYDDQVAQIQSQAANDRVTAATNGLQLAKSRTRNSIQQAQLELQIATTTLATLRASGGSADAIQNAAVQQNQAILALQDSQAEERLAALSTKVDRKYAPSDAVGKARGQLTIALATQRDAARRFGTNSTQYQQATQGVIDAQRGITSALQGVAEANSNLAIAYASATGNTVKAAQLQLQAAQRKLREAIKNSGGKTNTADVKNAQAAVVTAQAAARDAVFQSNLDTINFNHDMGYSSTQATIAQLQNLLKMKNLTKAEQRQVLLQIHQLQQSLVDDLTSSGFNIPNLGNVKLPTPYEVRRSLGIDKLQGTLKDAVNVQDGGFSLSTPTGQTGNSEMVSAIKQVQAAVVAKGAQHIAVDQKNNFSVPTAAVAKQIAAQVITIINQQNGTQARATSTTPRNVATK